MRSFIRFSAVIATAVIAASGCDKTQSWLDEKQSSVDKGVQGRMETVNIEALGAVGQNSTAVRKGVDRVLDINDQKEAELEKAIGR